ncbi:hypothetical protein ACTHTA_11500, partial [Neisseria sp. P0013.S005]|uniref:hypothetical protein n=1 Tax=Neisseria sp. P0013.S005 TaxID=3436741 RepID=UPI003F8178F6
AGQGSTILWDMIPGAASYRVQINNLTNHTVQVNDVVSTEELAVTLRQPGQYAIWLQAISDTGFTSPWSAATNFEIQNAYQLIGTRTPLSP